MLAWSTGLPWLGFGMFHEIPKEGSELSHGYPLRQLAYGTLHFHCNTLTLLCPMLPCTACISMQGHMEHVLILLIHYLEASPAVPRPGSCTSSFSVALSAPLS